MAGIKDYSTTNLNNTSLNGISVAEGMLPSNLNNAIRALMVNTREWFIIDNKRSASSGNNVNSANLVPSTTSAEWVNDGWGAMDLYSTGFKIRTNDSNKNSSGTYIYLAIGQTLVGSNNIPCTAR